MGREGQRRGCRIRDFGMVPSPRVREQEFWGGGGGWVKATRQRKDVKSREVIRLVLRLARAYFEFLYGKG